MSLLYSKSKKRIRYENAWVFQFQNSTNITVKRGVFYQPSTKKWVVRYNAWWMFGETVLWYGWDVYILINLQYAIVEIRARSKSPSSRDIPIQLTNWITAVSMVFSRENITYKKRSIGRFVERHLLIEWCLKPSKTYISSIKTLYIQPGSKVPWFNFSWNWPFWESAHGSY